MVIELNVYIPLFETLKYIARSLYYTYRKDAALIVVYMVDALRSCLMYPTQIQLLLLDLISVLVFLSSTMIRFCNISCLAYDYYTNILSIHKQDSSNLFFFIL